MLAFYVVLGGFCFPYPLLFVTHWKPCIYMVFILICYFLSLIDKYSLTLQR